MIIAGTPYDAAQVGPDVGNGGGTPITVNGVTSLTPNTLVVYVATANSATASPFWSGEANAGVSGLTERVDYFDPTAGRHIGVWTGVKAVPGATGILSLTPLNAASFGGQGCLALRS